MNRIKINTMQHIYLTLPDNTTIKYLQWLSELFQTYQRPTLVFTDHNIKLFNRLFATEEARRCGMWNGFNCVIEKE